MVKWIQDLIKIKSCFNASWSVCVSRSMMHNKHQMVFHHLTPIDIRWWKIMLNQVSHHCRHFKMIRNDIWNGTKKNMSFSPCSETHRIEKWLKSAELWPRQTFFLRLIRAWSPAQKHALGHWASSTASGIGRRREMRWITRAKDDAAACGKRSSTDTIGFHDRMDGKVGNVVLIFWWITRIDWRYWKTFLCLKPIRFHRPNSFQGGPLCFFFLLQHPYSGVPNFLPIPILISISDHLPESFPNSPTPTSNTHVQHQCCPRQGACWFIINVTMPRTRWHTSLASVALEILAGSAEGKEGSVKEPNFACQGRWHAITLWWTYKKLLKMAIEIVDFPIKNGDFPLLCLWVNTIGAVGAQNLDHSDLSKPIPFLRVDNYDNSSQFMPIHFHQQSKRHKQCPSISCKQEPAAAALRKK